MKDQSGTTQELMEEISALKQRIKDLEQSKSGGKKGEGELMRSEARFRSYFDLPLHGIAITSPEKRWIEVNDRICSIMGYTREEFVRMTWSEITHPDDLAADVEQFNRLLSGQIEQYTMDKRFIRKDGTVIFTNIAVGCVRESDGRVNYIVALMADITDQKRAEEALREGDDRFKNLYHESPIPTFTWQKRRGDFILIDFNRAALQITNGKASYLLGDSAVDLYKNSPHILSDMNLCFQKRSVVRREITSQNFAPGRQLSVHYGFIPPDLIIVHTEDQTERKQADQKLQDTLEILTKAFGTIIQVMVSAVESRDPYTAGHQIRSANLALTIGAEMELPQDKIDGIRMAASIHDIGKLSIPVEILSKPTKLSELEFGLFKEHSRRGYEMLKDVESPWPLAEIVYQHHERMDGSGYPRNLKGNDILMEARILAVADVVESMSSHRPYRPGLGIDAALEDIEKNRGLLYDSHAVETCLRLFREKGFKLEC